VLANIDGVTSNYVIPGDSLLAYSNLDTATNKIATDIYAMRLNGTNSLSFNFQSNTAVPGTYPLRGCYIAAGGTTGTSQTIVTASPTITITEFGPPVTGFVAGSFAIQMNFSGTVRNVSVSFRVHRY
jgi:hypothetical protein